MPPPRRLEDGSLLASRYEIVRQLGATRMSEVFEAWDRKLEEKVAVKIVRAASTDTEARTRLRQEVRLARKVHHKNVGAIHDCGEDGDLEFISMELVEGRDLRHVLEAKQPFDWDRAYALILEIGEGLAAVHEAGIIHRDLKPANIMVEPSGHPRVMDFGIAKAESGPALSDTSEGIVKGTPEYMSPEQVRGRGIDFRSDLYAFGIVIFEIFYGRVPFRGETPVLTMLKHVEEPPPLDPAPLSLPSALVPVLRRALAKDAGERFASCAEMLAALREAWAQVDTDKIGTPRRGDSGERHTDIVLLRRKPQPGAVLPALPEETRLLVPMLTRALANVQSEVRVSAARALALQGPGAAVAIDGLRALLRDPVAEVQVEAAAALRAIEPVVRPESGPAAPPAPVVEPEPTPPPVRAGPTVNVHEASPRSQLVESEAHEAATQAALDTPEPLAEAPPGSAPAPPSRVPPASPAPAPVPPPAPPAATPVRIPAPASPPGPSPPLATPLPPTPSPQPSPPAPVVKRHEPILRPAPRRTTRGRLPPWLLMLAVAAGVLGLGRYVTRPTSTVAPPAPPSPSPAPEVDAIPAEATLPEATPPVTAPPAIVTAPPAPRKATGTAPTPVAPPTTLTLTITVATPTTMPTTTSTTLEAEPPVTAPPSLEGTPVVEPESTTTTTTLPIRIPPQCLKCPPPTYPTIALTAKKEGTVELRLKIDEAGRVVDVQVLKGEPALAEAAVKSAWARVYRPASRGGVPEAATVDVPFEFRLPK